MKRITLNVDLNDNEILDLEIRKMIEAAVETKTREYFYQTMEAEVENVANKCSKSWTESGYNKPSKIQRIVTEHIDAQIKEEIGTVTVTRNDIITQLEERTQSQLSMIDKIIKDGIASRLDKIDFEALIHDITAKEVQKMVPTIILELLADKLKN